MQVFYLILRMRHMNSLVLKRWLMIFSVCGIVDDAFRMGHDTVGCTRDIRCCNCYNYGHKAKNCLNRFSKRLQKWVPKKSIGGINSGVSLKTDKEVSASNTTSIQTKIPLAVPASNLVSASGTNIVTQGAGVGVSD
jgi:hypothetical protein